MKAGRQRRLARFLLARGWNRDQGSVRHRVWRATSEWRPWWNWGRPVMSLVGSDNCGNYDFPKPRTLYWRYEGRDMVKVWSWKEMKAIHVAEDDWQWIGIDEDDCLRLGWYSTGQFYGLTRREQALLIRWIIRWRFTDWFGLRTWIYRRALHAAVHQHRPFSCGQTPPRGSGGYDHWHCQEARNHTGPHRFNSMTWPADGEAGRVRPFDGPDGPQPTGPRVVR